MEHLLVIDNYNTLTSLDCRSKDSLVKEFTGLRMSDGLQVTNLSALISHSHKLSFYLALMEI